MQYEGNYRQHYKPNAQVQRTYPKRHHNFPSARQSKHMKLSQCNSVNSGTGFFENATIRSNNNVKLTLSLPFLVTDVTQTTYFRGPTWDSSNLTCAIDTAIASIQHLYFNISGQNKVFLMRLSPWIEEIARTSNIDITRNQLMNALHQLNPNDFPLGPVNKSLSEVVQAIFSSSPDNSITYSYMCDVTNQHYQHSTPLQPFQIPYNYEDSTYNSLISSLLGPLLKCNFCNSYHNSHNFALDQSVPLILIAHNPSIPDYNLVRNFAKDGRTYILQTILYYKNSHFTCCLFKETYTYWYDGMHKDGNATAIEPITTISYNGNTPVLFIYSL